MKNKPVKKIQFTVDEKQRENIVTLVLILSLVAEVALMFYLQKVQDQMKSDINRQIYTHSNYQRALR